MKKICYGFVGLLALAACDKADDNVYVCDKYTVEITTSENGDTLTADINLSLIHI